jgi:uncharacterized protein YndB with AHSA1/START domain
MSKLAVTAEGTTRADPAVVWSLVADANAYPVWGPWNDGGYRPAAAGPSQQGQVQWFRYGRRTTTTERILEVEEGRRLVYTVEHGLPVKHYRAEVVLTPTGAQGTAISWQATWDHTVLGRLVRRKLQQTYLEVVAALVAAAERTGTPT